MAATGPGLELRDSSNVSVLDGKLYVDRPADSPKTFKALSLLALGRTDPIMLGRIARLYPEVEVIEDSELHSVIKDRQNRYTKEISAWEKTRDAWQYVDGEKYCEPSKKGILNASGNLSVKASKTINPLPACLSHGQKSYRALAQIMESWTPGDKLNRMRLIVKNDPQRYFNGVTLISEHVIASTVSQARGEDGGTRSTSVPFQRKLELESTKRGTQAVKIFNSRPHGFETVFNEGEEPVKISIRNGLTAKTGFRFSMLQVLGDGIDSETEPSFDPNHNISAEAVLVDQATDLAHRLSRDPRESPRSHKVFQDYSAPLGAGRFAKGEKYTTFLPTFIDPKELKPSDFEPELREGRRPNGRIRLIESRVKDLWVDRKKLADGKVATEPGVYRIEKELKEMEDAYNGYRYNKTEGVSVVAYPGELVNQELHPGIGKKGLTEQEQIYNFLAMLARWSEDFPERWPEEIHVTQVTRLNQNGADFPMFVAMIRFKTAANAKTTRKDILTGEALPDKKLRRVPTDIREYMRHYGEGCAISKKFNGFVKQWRDLRKLYVEAIDYMEKGNGLRPKEEVWREIDAETKPILDPSKVYSVEEKRALEILHVASKKERRLKDKMFRDVDLGEAKKFIKDVPDFERADNLASRKNLTEAEQAELITLRERVHNLEEDILLKMKPLLPFLVDQKYLDETRPLSFINDDDESAPYMIPGYCHTTLHAIADIGLPSFRGAETTSGEGVFEIEHMTPQFFYDLEDGLGSEIKLTGSWGENFDGVCLSFANRCLSRPQDTIHRTSFNVSPRAEVLGDRTAEPFLRVVMKALYTDEEIVSGKTTAPNFYYDPATPLPFQNDYLLKERYEKGRGYRNGYTYPFGSEKTKRYRNEDGLINANRLPYEAAELNELKHDRTGQELVDTHRQQDMWMKEDGQAAFHGITREDGFGMAFIDHPSGTDPEDSPRSNNLREVLGNVNWMQMYSGEYKGLPKRRIINLEHHYMYGSHYGHLRDPITGQIIHTSDSEPSFREFTAFGYVEEAADNAKVSLDAIMPSSTVFRSKDAASDRLKRANAISGKILEFKDSNKTKDDPIKKVSESRKRSNALLIHGLKRIDPKSIFSEEVINAMKN